jgi:Protein of unknown function (DUF2742)
MAGPPVEVGPRPGHHPRAEGTDHTITSTSDRQNADKDIVSQVRPQPSSVEGGATSSQEVSWWCVHQFLEAALAQANIGPLPWAGTPAWCELSDGDPRKLLALAIAGEHHVLRVETAQAAMAEASQAISAADDWGRVGQRIRQHNEFYADRPWLKRVDS